MYLIPIMYMRNERKQLIGNEEAERCIYMFCPA